MYSLPLCTSYWTFSVLIAFRYMLQRDSGIDGAVRLSFHPPVRPSVTSWYPVTTNARRITRVSPPGSQGTLVFDTNCHTLGLRRIPWVGFKRQWWAKKQRKTEIFVQYIGISRKPRQIAYSCNGRPIGRRAWYFRWMTITHHLTVAVAGARCAEVNEGRPILSGAKDKPGSEDFSDYDHA